MLTFPIESITSGCQAAFHVASTSIAYINPSKWKPQTVLNIGIGVIRTTRTVCNPRNWNPKAVVQISFQAGQIVLNPKNWNPKLVFTATTQVFNGGRKVKAIWSAKEVRLQQYHADFAIFLHQTHEQNNLHIHSLINSAKQTIAAAELSALNPIKEYLTDIDNLPSTEERSQMYQDLISLSENNLKKGDIADLKDRLSQLEELFEEIDNHRKFHLDLCKKTRFNQKAEIDLHYQVKIINANLLFTCIRLFTIPFGGTIDTVADTIQKLGSSSEALNRILFRDEERDQSGSPSKATLIFWYSQHALNFTIATLRASSLFIESVAQYESSLKHISTALLVFSVIATVMDPKTHLALELFGQQIITKYPSSKNTLTKTGLFLSDTVDKVHSLLSPIQNIFTNTTTVD